MICLILPPKVLHSKQTDKYFLQESTVNSSNNALNTKCQECWKRGAREALGLPLSFKSIVEPMWVLTTGLHGQKSCAASLL